MTSDDSHITFEEVYNLYFREVYMYIRALSHDEHVAEEITQETFFKALKSLHLYDPAKKMSVWLCQIAKNTYFSHLRKGKHLFSEDISDLEITDDMDCFAPLLMKDQTDALYCVLHNLGDPYKEVFMLRIFSELAFADIAKIFGKTESWARVTFYRAKRKIKDGLGGEQA